MEKIKNQQDQQENQQNKNIETVQIQQSQSIQEIKSVKLLDTIYYESTSLVWSKCKYFSDSQFGIGLEKGEVVLVDLEKRKCNFLILKDSPQTQVKDLIFLQNNSIMIICYFQRNMTVWDLKDNNKKLKTLPYSSFCCISIQDRYIAAIQYASQILILDSKKNFQIAQRIQLEVINNGNGLNLVRFLSNFQPCTYLLTFIDNLYLYTYNFVTKKFINKLKLFQNEVPIRVKTYRKDHHYYALILLKSHKIIVVDIIKGTILFSEVIVQLLNVTIQCIEFIDPQHFIVGSSRENAYIMNFYSKQNININLKDGFVGAFTMDKIIATTSDKNKSISIWCID